jgi:uncharacterized protein YkwD
VPTTTRRLAPLLLAGLLSATLAAPAMAATPTPADEATATQAGLDLVSLANRQRVALGLVTLPADPDLMAIARARAEVMAANDVMSHTEPDGRKVFDRLDAAGLTWYSAGEIIAWNNYPTEPLSVAESIYAWMHSPPHREIMVSTGYNYVGFGAARSATGRWYYAGVFVWEPDETGAVARVSTPSRTIVTAALARVLIRWTGADPRLQLGTAGLRDFEVQRRVLGGPWWSWGTTTATWRAVWWRRGVTFEVRVRARDRAGNWGPWGTTRITA